MTWKGLFAALVLTVLLVGVAHAEQKVISGVTGRTYQISNQYGAYTSATSIKNWLYANERAWAAGGTNPLKDQQIRECFMCTHSGTAYVSSNYPWTTTKHTFRTNAGDNPTNFYTSGTGCQSSSCWWNGNTSCSGTC